VAHFDRAIPPGGEGKITLTVDLGGYDGPVRKDATVKSNDAENSSITLTVKGTVKQLIQVRPGTSISFHGAADQTKEAVIDFMATGQPFHISKIETDLEGKAKVQLQTVTEGQHYQLKVNNLLAEGDYNGFIKLMTDLSRAKDPIIRVFGRIEGELKVSSKSFSMGKFPSEELIESRTVSVLSNHRKPFQITRLSYDENLIKVDVQPLPEKTGYDLVVSARMANVPSGNPVQTTITVQTDLDPQAKQEIHVHLFNQAN
jgi:hypothetical protein